MTDPLIKKRSPADQVRNIADRLLEQPDQLQLIGYSLVLTMIADTLGPEPGATVQAAYDIDASRHDERREHGEA